MSNIIEINYNIEHIKDLLGLDETDFDPSLNQVYDSTILENIEPLIITKVLGFDENYIEAIKYMLYVIKQVDESEHKQYKKTIYSSIKQFIFGDINIEYTNSLFNNLDVFTNKKSIVLFTEKLNEDELNKFINLTKSYEKKIRYNLINILTQSKKLRRVFTAKTITGKNYEKDLNIISFIKDNDGYLNDNEYINSFKNYLEDEDSKKYIIEFIIDILDKNKNCSFDINTSLTTDFTILSSTRYLSLVLKCILTIFDSIDKDKIFSNLEEKTFENTNRKDFIPNSDDNFETQIYLLTIRSFRLIHNYVCTRYQEVNSMNTGGGIFGQLFGVMPTDINARLKIVKEIVFNDELNKYIEKFINYYVEKFLQINSDAVDTIIQFYFNMNKIHKNYKYPDNIIGYFCKLLGTSSEYCNKHYKFDVLSILCSIYEKNKTEIKDPLRLLESIIIYHDENDMFKSEQIQTAHTIYQSSIKILERIINTNEIKENSMNDIFLKFFYRTNSHTISFIEMINMVCDEVSKKVNDYNSSTYRKQYSPMILGIIESIKLSLNLVNIILQKGILNPAVFRGEILLPVITLATNVLKYFTNGKNVIYDVFNMNYETLDIMRLSLKVLHKLSINDEFKELIQDTKEIITESLPFIKFKEDEEFIKKELKENLEYKQGEVKLDDVPEEFLDPLIYTLIKEPTMIPNVDLIFDKSSIMSQIYHEKINPYTREYLDEETLEKYNKEEQIVIKLKMFLDKFNKWRSANV